MNKLKYYNSENYLYNLWDTENILTIAFQLSLSILITFSQFGENHEHYVYLLVIFFLVVNM